MPAQLQPLAFQCRISLVVSLFGGFPWSIRGLRVDRYGLVAHLPLLSAAYRERTRMYTGCRDRPELHINADDTVCGMPERSASHIKQLDIRIGAYVVSTLQSR